MPVKSFGEGGMAKSIGMKVHYEEYMRTKKSQLPGPGMYALPNSIAVKQSTSNKESPNG
jgi:hypothetical protein